VFLRGVIARKRPGESERELLLFNKRKHIFKSR
jgi:hypothetical protein